MARELVRLMLERVDETFYHKCMKLLAIDEEILPGDLVEFAYAFKILGEDLERFAAWKTAQLVVE